MNFKYLKHKQLKVFQQILIGLDSAGMLYLHS
jgi:hypothetical protein